MRHSVFPEALSGSRNAKYPSGREFVDKRLGLVYPFLWLLDSLLHARNSNVTETPMLIAYKLIHSLLSISSTPLLLGVLSYCGTFSVF